MRKIIAGASMLLLSVVQSGTSFAADIGGVAAPTVAVRYGDLDLSTSQGRASLHRRVGAAVDKLCEYGKSRDLSAQAAASRCRKVAMAAGEKDMAALNASRSQLAAVPSGVIAVRR